MWSYEGPVSKLVVAPEITVQSKSSVSICRQPHIVLSSKSQFTKEGGHIPGSVLTSSIATPPVEVPLPVLAVKITEYFCQNKDVMKNQNLSVNMFSQYTDWFTSSFSVPLLSLCLRFSFFPLYFHGY